MDSQAKLAGKRVLVIEDEYMIADDLRRLFEANGTTVAGPYSSSASAMNALPEETFDCAVLDIALSGNAVYPLAAELRRRNTPFAFLTGFSRDGVHPDFADIPMLEKPYDNARVIQLVLRLLGQQR